MPAYNLSQLRVMVADDSKIMRETLGSILDHFKIKDLCLVDSGQDVLMRFHHFDPDILIIDREMEPIDGLALTKIIRHPAGGFKPTMPIVMITSSTSTQTLKQALDAGVSEILTKPITPENLYGCMVSLIETPRKFIHTQEYFGPDRRGRLPSSLVPSTTMDGNANDS